MGVGALPLRLPGGSVRILVTTDTFSGVWTYTRELVSGLVTQGCPGRPGELRRNPTPASDQLDAWLARTGISSHRVSSRLDAGRRAGLSRGAGLSVFVIRDTRPDLLHLNQLSFGALPVETPRVVIAHGDIITWWLSVHDREPASSAWLDWYRHTIVRGLQRAEAVVTTSRWMHKMLQQAYGDEFEACVVAPGRNPIYFNPFVTKEESVLAIGRLWDTGKQVALLTHQPHGMPVCIVGADHTIPAPPVPIRADVRVSTGKHEIAVKGAQTESQLRALYSKSTIFAATSRYEPMGLSSIEAAFSRCALVANDTPVFRELWGDAALYFERNDADSLSETLGQLHQDHELARQYGTRAYNRARERFTARRMVDDYLRLYRQLRTSKVAVA